METKELNQIAVLNTGFLGLLESGKEIDCRVMDVSLEDIQATVLYFGGEIELAKHDYVHERQSYSMILRVQKGESKITLVYSFKNRVSYACQMESFGFLTMWHPGAQLTIADNSYLIP